jgi:hypothetical protein
MKKKKRSKRHSEVETRRQTFLREGAQARYGYGPFYGGGYGPGYGYGTFYGGFGGPGGHGETAQDAQGNQGDSSGGDAGGGDGGGSQ